MRSVFPSEGGGDLGEHPRFIALVTGREVERLDTSHISRTRDLAGRTRRQMIALSGQSNVSFCKGRLNEKKVGILGEPHYRLPVLF
jgi:hypothetical protein